MLTIHRLSHLDHSLTEAQRAHIIERFADREAFFIETFELPEELGTVPCGLHGPLMGDAPITDGVQMGVRGTRPYASRLVRREPRPTRMVTVIAGPHEDEKCILYTAFGGPLTPKEPGETGAAVLKLVGDVANEIGLPDTAWSLLMKANAEYQKSVAFWAEHALSV